MRLTALKLMLLSSSLVTAPPLLALGETEPNHPIDTAQVLTIVSQTNAMDGALGNGGPGDLDYYVFSGKAGDVVTLDIDRGAGDASSVDTVLAIFGPGPAYSMLRLNDDAPVDPGSVSARDARIEKFVLPQTGRYLVGVSNYPRYFLSGGGVRNGAAAVGDYQLVVSGVSPSVKQIAIEVKPGSEDVAPINPRSKGKIPVALLGNPDFEVMSVDPASLTFGATGGEASFVKCEWTGSDINGDGRVDRVCHFDNEKANFKQGSLEGILRGRTRDGMMIEGRAFLKVVPQKAE